MDDNDEKEIARVNAIMHARRAKVLEVLREGDALCGAEQAAVVYTLTIEPGIREHMPGVYQSLKGALELRAQTCQCPTCKAERAQA